MGEPPNMTKSLAGDQDQTTPRLGNFARTATSPELPDGSVGPHDAFNSSTDVRQSPSPQSLSSSQPRNPPRMPPSKEVEASARSVAFSAMQSLPVPLLVLSSLKRVALANAAMGTLLGVIHESVGDGNMAISDLIQGLSLSQLGIEVTQDGRITPFDWERYLDSLINQPVTGVRASAESDADRAHRSDRYGHSSAHLVNTDVPDKVSQRPGQTGVIEVLINKKDPGNSSSDPISRAKAAATQCRAKVIIAPFQLSSQQTYFNLAFTDVKTGQSSTPQPTGNKAVLGSGDEHSAGDNPLLGSPEVDQVISRIKEEDEERFRMMCDAMPQLVWTTTPEGNLDFCNQRWYEFTGLTPDASVQHGWTRAVHPDDVPKSERLFRQSLETGEPFETEYRCRSRAGEWNWFIVRAVPFRSKETGEIARWLGTCTDANETIETRHEVQRTWQQLLTVISHAQVTVFQVDTQRRVTLLEGAMVEAALGGHEITPRWYGGRDMYEVFGQLSKAPDERQQRFLGPIEAILAGHPTEILQDDEFGKLSHLDEEDVRCRAPAN